MNLSQQVFLCGMSIEIYQQTGMLTKNEHIKNKIWHMLLIVSKFIFYLGTIVVPD